jgi:hypothetical protein
MTKGQALQKTEKFSTKPVLPKSRINLGIDEIYLFGQRFCPNFLDEGDTIRSETEWLQDLNSQGIVDFSILVKKDTGKTIIHFEYCDNENQIYRNTDYPSISSLTEWRRNSPPFMAEIQGVFHYFYSYVTYNMI